MSDLSVDFYDVQRMAEGEARERRAAVDELRELVAQREREAHEAILELREHVASLERLIQSRTEHLV
jgi:uncharacterized protein YdhG (YjbR/CyaY superfamily)